MYFLKTRYLSVLIVYLSVFLVGILFLDSNPMQHSVLDSLKSKALDQTISISGGYQDYVEAAADPDQIRDWLKSIEQNYQQQAFLINTKSELIPSGRLEDPVFQEADKDLLPALFQGETNLKEFFNPESQITEFRTCVPVADKHKTILYVLCLSQPLALVENTAEQELADLKLIWIITLLVAAVVTLLILHFTISPIRKLTHALEKMPDDAGYPNIRTNRQDEIGNLIWAINKLLAHFNDQTNVLKNESIKRNSILKYMSDGIIIVNEEDIVEELNIEAQRIFEIEESEAVGLTLVEVVRHHKLIELHQSCMKSRKQESMTFETIPNKLFLRGVASPLQPPLEGFTLLVIQDLTRLRHLEMVRKDFVSNVSHELRTPIASIKALAETLSEGAIDDPKHARRFLGMMEGEIDNINQMIQELLELSRIEAGKAILDRISIDPNTLTHKAYERMLIQAERAKLTLEWNVIENLPPVYADPAKIGQVFINLIHNAIKFSSAGDTITLSAHQEGKNIIFSVIDEGIGIEPNNINRIFERFYKEDIARSGQGTGLGLAIAKHIIESHGGKIWAKNKQPNGSIFSFTLPIL